MESLKYALIMIINLVFDTYVFVLLIRLFLQKFGASWGNPISQLVVKLTEPVVKPCRRFLPGFKGFDLAILFAALVIELIEQMLLLWIKINVFPGILGSIVIAFGALGNKAINIYFFGILISVVMSWIPALQQNPVGGIVRTITDPLLQFARRYVPLIGGMDLSPIPVLLVLKLVTILLFNPIITAGYKLAF